MIYFVIIYYSFLIVIYGSWHYHIQIMNRIKKFPANLKFFLLLINKRPDYEHGWYDEREHQ